MNYRMISRLLGFVLLLIAAFLLLPVIVALIYGDGGLWSLVQTALVCGALGGLMMLLKPKDRTMHARDGFVLVSLSWILISLLGALPFWLSGAIPSYLEAVFETVSGFTTTGASILTDVESIPHGLLFWRSFTHWLGGMGVLVFMLAVVPLSGESIYLLKAESPGPSVSKMVPKMRTTALILYGIYFTMTMLQIFAYQLGNLCGWGEISFFDSVCLAFGSAGTGGFAVRNTGLAAYSAYVQTVTTVGMIMFGVNFSIYFFVISRKFKLIRQNTELKYYLAIILGAVVIITANLMLTGNAIDGSLGETARHVSFSVGSIITTTGFSTVDFSRWPELSRTILVLLMICGACAGSTGGGLKVSRIVILAKTARSELQHLLHPHSVQVMKMDGKRVDREVIRGTQAYLVFYILIAVISLVIVSLDSFGADTTMTSVMATLNNIGPGTTILIGPSGCYHAFSSLSKIVLIIDMLFGRLEFFPMLILLRPSTWRKH